MAWWFGSGRRATRRYARELPPWLIASFGASEFYTPGQIKAGIKALKLNQRYADLALAAFSSEADYRRLTAEQSKALSYEDARASFFRWKPGGLEQRWNPLEVENTTHRLDYYPPGHP